MNREVRLNTHLLTHLFFQRFVHQQLFIEKPHLSNKITVFVYKLCKYFVSYFNSHSLLGLSFHWEILYC